MVSPPPTLPLDLHVLSLSLAFILSQDQTLRCVFSSSLFSLNEKMPRAHTSVSRSSCNVTPHWWPAATASPGARPQRAAAGRTAAAPYVSPVTRNLDLWGAPRNPRFLVSHLLVRFPHRKHVNDLSSAQRPGRRSFLTRRQKNRSTRNCVLVSRKAMQNYCRRTTWQNISARKSRKRAIFNSHSHLNRHTKDILRKTPPKGRRLPRKRTLPPPSHRRARHLRD